MEPYIGQISMFAFRFAPIGWALCNGQSLPIAQNQALYALIGTTYGGTATTFNLPDLRGRIAMHRSTDAQTNYREGQAGGTETVALTTASQLPPHSHTLTANSAAGNGNSPAGVVPAAVQDAGNPQTMFAYTSAKASPAATLAAGSLATAGASLGHDNVQPSLVINYCIALSGIWPSRG